MEIDEAFEFRDCGRDVSPASVNLGYKQLGTGEMSRLELLGLFEVLLGLIRFIEQKVAQAQPGLGLGIIRPGLNSLQKNLDALLRLVPGNQCAAQTHQSSE